MDTLRHTYMNGNSFDALPAYFFDKPRRQRSPKSPDHATMVG
jgi:hypothetical protein